MRAGYIIDVAEESTELFLRANLTFFRAMLTGSLRSWFVDGGERWQFPGWAWVDQGGDWRALIIGNDFLHPLAPPEVRRWAWLPVQVERAALKAWLYSEEMVNQTGFPDLPPAYDEAIRPSYVTRLDPPDQPNVSLAQFVWRMGWTGRRLGMSGSRMIIGLPFRVRGFCEIAGVSSLSLCERTN